MEMFDYCFLLMLLCAFFPALVVIHAQLDHQSGFISIDCGAAPDNRYTDDQTSIKYISDESVTDTGLTYSISANYNFEASVTKQLHNLRSFPEGSRNCYILKPAAAKGKSNKYLIRATFYHGKYDADDGAKNKLPILFDLHVGVNYWDTVNITSFTKIYNFEIIHIPSYEDIIHVCLINTGFGTPFISALELRPLQNELYQNSTVSQSLILVSRLDLGSDPQTGQTIRYEDDIYDRRWKPEIFDGQKEISTTTSENLIERSIYRPPYAVMCTAVTPLNSSSALSFTLEVNDIMEELYFNMHFAELEVVDKNSTDNREFNIYVNGDLLYGPLMPKYLTVLTVYTTNPVTGWLTYEVIVNKTGTSTLPPIVNALEVYSVRKLPNSQTDKSDFDAIMDIKSNYNVVKNWQGDPCGPASYVWIGLNCSCGDSSGPPRIISVNLSSSGLIGKVVAAVRDLAMLQTLDLSNNNLIGPVPNFLAELESLKTLNLRGNNFSGPVPTKLLEKVEDGLLSLSMDDVTSGTDPCEHSPCEKKNKVIIPVVVSISAIILLLISMAIFWIIRRRKRAQQVKTVSLSNNNDKELESNNKRFTYSQILKITNNFQNTIGQGGFGTVYHGYIDKTEVAVKILSSSSSQGYKEFLAEANVLINVHHKNLTSMVGYCMDKSKLMIIYEYMAHGDLQNHLADSDQKHVLSWRERLQIAIDAAQGLEYLHHGCTQPIIHRDIKCTNILLDNNFKAKLGDFGLSRAFPIEGGTHLSTVVAGTPGYLDPEYYMSNRLTEKSDVFSFGVVLLEMFTGRPAIQNHEEDHIHIKQWVSSILREGDVMELIDSRIMANFDINSAWKAIEIAMACVASDSGNRPTMNTVVTELKECLAMEMNKAESKTILDSIGYMSPDHSVTSPLVR